MRYLYLVRRDWLDETWPDPRKLRLAGLGLVFVTLILQISTNSICFATLATPYGWPSKSFFDHVPIKIQSVIILVCLFVFLFPVGVSIAIYLLLLKHRRSFEVKNKVGILRSQCHSNEHSINENKQNSNDVQAENRPSPIFQENNEILSAANGKELSMQISETQLENNIERISTETSENIQSDNLNELSIDLNQNFHRNSAVKVRSFSVDIEQNTLNDNKFEFQKEKEKIKLSISLPNLKLIEDLERISLNKNGSVGQRLEMVNSENEKTLTNIEVLSTNCKNNLESVVENQLTSVQVLIERENACHRQPNSRHSSLSSESELNFHAEKLAAIRYWFLLLICFIVP